MARNIKHMSGWARNLVIKVRNELSSGISSNIIGTRLGYTQPLKGNNWELDQYYIDLLNDKERRIDYEEKYRRLMGSAYGHGPDSSSKKFALEFHIGIHGKYTGPLTYEEIEAIEDITKETK
jgi:hypothetical protein